MDKKLEDFTDKKELKEFVNENGFFFNMVVNTINRDSMNEALEDFSTNAIETGINVPEWDNIMIFKGLASQGYKKKEKNRNGYKIDPNGWIFDNYLYNPIILLQHNANNGGIGKAIKFDIKKDGLNILFFVDLNTLDEKSRYQVQNGYITAISTGSITEEDGIEEVSTGKIYSIEDAMEKFWRENVRKAFRWESDDYIYVVTKAQLIENSLVTIWSNEKAIALPNAIGKYALNKHAPLIAKMEEMKNKLVNEVEETPAVETTEVVEEPTVETPTEEVASTPVEEANDTEETATEEATEEATTEPVVEETPEASPVETTENDVETTEGNSLKAEDENSLVAELQNSLSEKDKVIAEQNELLENATKTIVELNTLIEAKDQVIGMAKNYLTSLWQSFDANSLENSKKTIIENRIKVAQK